jgi:uncharacterized protein
MAAMLEKWTWAVVGSHGRNPICDRLVNKLNAGHKKVFRVNPGAPSAGPDLVLSLRACGEPIDVVDLVINPAKGVSVVDEMGQLGIKNLWIQPGASSPEVLAAARKYNINVHEGCVLVEGPW